MIAVSNRAAEALRKELVQKCLESGLGFRLMVTKEPTGKISSTMKFDRQRQGDEVLELDGIIVFSDTASASTVRDFNLDFEEPQGGFFLKKVLRQMTAVSA